MIFWKEHAALRVVLMALSFVLGLVLLFVGWKTTGQLLGLGVMILGLVLLLTTLALYNKPFEEPKKKK
ncbi:MAG: hypothetical protein GXW99_10585 [Clostridiales bacterium]|nr:hypothetical protein [Clostridiales bacterium]